MAYALVILAYLLGSISTAIISCKAMGLPDPRTGGSGNPGATNVLRLGGKKAAIITLLGDALKGLIPVLIGQALGLTPIWLLLIGLAAFLGHLYPLYYGFSGGKGIATALGVYFGLNVWLGLLALATWLFIAKILKISSLAGLSATLIAPLYYYLLDPNGYVVFGLSIMTVLVFWRHRSNIQSLINGTENLIKTDKVDKNEDH